MATSPVPNLVRRIQALNSTEQEQPEEQVVEGHVLDVARQNGSSSVMPSEPLVRPPQLVATICAASSSAIVMMTNACPRVRSTTAPTRVAMTTATTPPSGAIHSGLTPGVAR